MARAKSLRFEMASLRRRMSVILGSRRLRPAGQRPVLLLLVLCALIAASCLLFSARNVSTGPQKVGLEDSPFSENMVSSKMFAPILPSHAEVSHRQNKPIEASSVVPDPPLPITIIDRVSAKTESYADYEEHDGNNEVGIFGSIATSLNLKPDSVLQKALNFADSVKRLSDDGPPVVESVFSIAKGLHSMSKKVSEVNQKRNLKLVQGFVNSMESKIDDDENLHKRFDDPEIPLGPEARKNNDFEKQMKQEEKKPSLLKSIAKNVAPAILSEFSKSTRESNNDGGPSLIENIFVNVGPKIIAEALGGRDEDNDGTERGSSRSGLEKALKFLTPFVKSVVERQEGEKEDVDTAVSSIINVVGGMSALFQGNDNGKRSLGDTVGMLKPVLEAMGPSIMEKILNSKRSVRSITKRPDDAERRGRATKETDKKTFVDQMLNGMDEKTVGQAMGRALSSVLVRALPDTVRLPRPSEIRRPYDMALNLVLGNPRNNSKEIWNWLRKLSGESPSVEKASSGDWISEALKNPKRLLYKEDIRHFYGLLNNEGGACRDTKQVGGVYDWKKDIILSSRFVCEDFDLWKAPSREAVSFGIGESWSFEEELVKRGNLRIHAVDPRLHQADYNHSQDIFFCAGRLAAEPSGSSPERKDSIPRLPFAGWLERWGLLQKPLHFVKIDLGGDEWEILKSITQDDPSSLEETQQLSVTVRMEKAIRDPSLYALYIEVLQSLASLGHQIFSSVPEPGMRGYDEPLVPGHEVVAAYRLGFVRT